MHDQSLSMTIPYNHSNWVLVYILQHFGRLKLDTNDNKFWSQLAVEVLEAFLPVVDDL